LKVGVFLSIFGLLFLSGCKTSEDAGQYTLTVTVAQGVSGTPAAGTTGYAEGDVVNYNYALQAGYENLVVKLDGATVASSGVVTMNMNHTLTVTADEKFNPTGFWKGWVYVTMSDYYFNIQFSGDYASGTASEAEIATVPGFGSGTYTISGNSINFILNYGVVSLEFWGTIEDNDHMKGNFQVNGGASGTWELARQ
jgi:hypothetical protein